MGPPITPKDHPAFAPCFASKFFNSDQCFPSSPSACLAFLRRWFFVKKKKTTHNFTVLSNKAPLILVIQGKKLQEQKPCGGHVPTVSVRRISLHLRVIFSPQPSCSAVVLSSLRDFIFELQSHQRDNLQRNKEKGSRTYI